MRVAIFGVKYNDSLESFRKQAKRSILKNKMKADDSYFDSSTDEDKSDPHKLYQRLNKILLRSDVAIIENTEYSNGIGFIIGKAAEMKKPVMVLFNRSGEKLPSIVIQAYEESQRFVFSEYDENDLEDVVTSFLKRARKLINTKYLFNLTPEMAKYLQWSSESTGRPMVDILRELLEGRMKDDQKWQDFDRS